MKQKVKYSEVDQESIMEFISLIGSLSLSVTNHLIGKILDTGLGIEERKQTAYKLIAETLNRYVEDKNARIRFGDIKNPTVSYRLVQILDRLYDDLITLIVTTNGLVEDDVTEKLKDLSSFIADLFNNVTYGIIDRDKQSFFESLKNKYSSYSSFVEHINNIEQSHITPLLRDIEEKRK